jgi:hypothetical protein
MVAIDPKGRERMLRENSAAIFSRSALPGIGVTPRSLMPDTACRSHAFSSL